MKQQILAFATVSFVSSCIIDEPPVDETAESQSVTTTVLMGCTFPGTFTAVNNPNECTALEPEKVGRILFTVNTALGLLTQRSWKVTVPIGEKEIRRSGCGSFDTTCEIATVPVCASGPFIPSMRNLPRRYTASIKSTPLLGGNDETAAGTAIVPPVNCVTDRPEIQPVCDAPPPLPLLRSEDTYCRGIYLFKFSKIPGTTRYEAESVQSGFDWSLARQEFNCAAETVAQDASFRSTLATTAVAARGAVPSTCNGPIRASERTGRRRDS
jgi:hypothetical protein